MSTFNLIALLCLAFVLQATPGLCFGAGNIPSYAYLEGKAFRHGDIEDILSELARSSGGASGLLGAVTGGLLAKKFGGLDIKRVYFGNWLRDYSQAMDTAGLTKLSVQAIINLVMVLGFLAHGYATGEFEVTEERLGVYLPVEHIDNPKDYADNKDARQVHPKLRGPVDPVELEVDQSTGMLNYIANENGHWDTSKALIRRVLLSCIDMGRRARSSGDHNALYEALRLLGTALHTLEDFSAHSNYCELALRKLGYNQIYCHVGENITIRSPNGQQVPPLVTGTFGGADFIHSLLGETTDHISSSSVSDLQKQVENAKNAPADRSIDGIRDLLFQLPGGDGQNLSREMDNVSNIRATTNDPMNMSPQELHAALWKILSFRDNVAKTIEQTIEKIPGLSSLVEKIGDSVAKFIFVTIEPYLKPVLQQATGVLSQGSAQVVNSHDQFKVFDDPNYAHPTHSFLSKDHFNGILNEPAGLVAKVIVKHTVEDIVKAWDNTSMDAHQIVENILPALHHPFFSRGHPLQNEMEQTMRRWIDSEDKNYTVNALTKDAVRNHKNHRKGHATEAPTQGPGGYTSFLPTPASLTHQASNYAHQQLNHVPGYQAFNQTFPTAFNNRDVNDGSAAQSGYDAQSQQPMYGGGSGHHSPAPFGGDGYGGPQQYDQPPPHQYGQDYYGGQGQQYNQFQQNNFEGGYGSHHGPPHGGHGGPQHGNYGGPGFDQPAPPFDNQYGQNQGGQYSGYGNQGGNYGGHQPPPPGRW